MSDVKRYKKHGEILGRVLVAAKDGDYVRHSDYAALRARLEAVEKDRDEQSTLAAVRQARAERAEAALATALNLIELAVELARWDLNPTLRDQLTDFATELGGKDE